MVTGNHPDDVVLFEYVEGELAGRERNELEAHLVACASCAEQVARAHSGHDALRSAQALELSPARRSAILAGLTPRAPGRRPQITLRRFVAVLAPVAAAGLVAVAVLTTDGFEPGGGGGEAGGAAAEETSAPTEALSVPTESTGVGQDRAATALSATGSPEEVADRLRSSGIQARVVGKDVEVRNASRADVRRALRGRRDGSVRIIIVR